MIVLITALGGCEREPARDLHGAAGPVSASPADAAAPRLEGAQLEALKDEVRKSLREELRPEVVAQLKSELTPLVRAELKNELRPPAEDAAGPSDGAGEPGPDATAPKDGALPEVAPPGGGDIWSAPGTKIWPSAGGLKLTELVVGTALEDKLPTNVKTHYPITPEILYCYSVFENPTPEATVTHVWRRGSRLVSRVELEVGNSPKWRTWSKQRTQPHWTGLWSCEVLGPEGQQLGLTVFQVGG